MKTNYIVITGIIILVAIVGLYALKPFTGKVVAQSDTKEFAINAFRFGYAPDAITVSKGDKVRIIINNTDTLHGIRIPELNIKGNEIIEFTADKTGEFDWYCANMCGNEHMQMKGKLLVR